MLWTGNGVVARTVTVQDFRNAESIFKHPLVLWDNYPVNDYKKTRLFLGPLEGRSSFLDSAGLTGILSNPMQQSEASKIPLFTIADYAWNPQAYNPEQSWQHALHEIGGDAYISLRIFAENNRTSLINHSPRIVRRGEGK
jgi:hyaluronoglucosaminidase